MKRFIDFIVNNWPKYYRELLRVWSLSSILLYIFGGLAIDSAIMIATVNELPKL